MPLYVPAENRTFSNKKRMLRGHAASVSIIYENATIVILIQCGIYTAPAQLKHALFFFRKNGKISRCSFDLSKCRNRHSLIILYPVFAKSTLDRNSCQLT